MQLPNWIIVAIAAMLVAAVAYDISKRTPADEATAINNNAVLRWRSTEGALDAQDIKAAFRKAAASGLVRADLNLLLATDACDDVAFEALAKRGDSRAASFAATCLAAKARSAGFSEDFKLAGCPERMLELARIATSDDKAAEHMKFGWLLSELRRGQGCGSQKSADRVLLEAGARHLLRAHELGVPAATARIGSILKDNPELVASLEVGSRLQQRPFYEWTQMAADEGHPASNCMLGADLTRAIEEGPRPVDMKRVRQATKLIAGCINYGGRDTPIRNVAGGEIKYAQDGYGELWRQEPAYLLRSPDHEDYNLDRSALNRAQHALSLLQKYFANHG
jgi:hypothetical protein